MDSSAIHLIRRKPYKENSILKEYFCEITSDIDNYNVGYQKAIYGCIDGVNLMRSYITEPVHGPYAIESPNFTNIPIRIPGSTIGHIKVTFTNIDMYYVDSIIFYKTTIKFLDGDYKSLEKKYTGRVLMYPREDE